MVTQQRDHAVQHADVHLLAAAGVLSRKQREDDALGGQQTRDHVGDGDADAKGRTIGIACHAHQPAFGLDDRVVSRLIARGPSCPKPEIEQKQLARGSLSVA